jgi:hypothetical protein
MSDTESAGAPDIEALMTVTTKPPSAKKKARKEGQSLTERSIQRIADAEKEHVEIGSDGSDAAGKPIVLLGLRRCSIDRKLERFCVRQQSNPNPCGTIRKR